MPYTSASPSEAMGSRVGTRFIASAGWGVWPLLSLGLIWSDPTEDVRINVLNLIIAPAGWGGANAAEFATDINLEKSQLLIPQNTPFLHTLCIFCR